jgi:RNA polymerase sigma-70 factor (ECF subfamily)
LRLANSILSNRADAEDVFQTVFLRLFSSGKRFAGDEHMKAWLLRVTVNCCKDELKGARRRRVVSLEAASMTPTTPATPMASMALMTEEQTSGSLDGGFSGGDSLGESPLDGGSFGVGGAEADGEGDMSRRLQEALTELPAKQRAALHLFYHDGYNTDEIAAIMEENPSTVRSHLHRARQSLRMKLGEHDA